MSMYGDWARHPFALDPNKPAWRQIALTIGGVGFVFAGPLLGLVTIKHFPPLVMDKTVYTVGLGAIGALFLATFAVIPNRMMPRGLPLAQNLAARAGWGLCGTALVLGLVGIANGYAMPVFTRDAPAVAKHESREGDPARRSHYVSVRAWPDSPAIVDLDAPPDVYARLDLPVTAIGAPQAALQAMPDAATVRLTLGEGRLGMTWLKALGLPPGVRR